MSEINPNTETPRNSAGAGGVIASVLVPIIAAVIIGGIGSVLFVDRNPTYQLDQVFLYSWASLFFALSALFAIPHSLCTRTLKNSLALPAVFLLHGILIGILGILLYRTAPWAWMLVLLVAVFGLPKLISRIIKSMAARCPGCQGAEAQQGRRLKRPPG